LFDLSTGAEAVKGPVPGTGSGIAFDFAVFGGGPQGRPHIFVRGAVGQADRIDGEVIQGRALSD